MCLVYQVKTSCFFSTHQLYELVFSILIKIQVEDAAALTNLFLNILDGVINDGTIDKNLINAEKTWSYIKKIIDLEKIEELVAI